MKMLGVEVTDKNELTELRPASTDRLAYTQIAYKAEAGKAKAGEPIERSLRVVTNDQLTDDSKKKLLKQVMIEVAPVARVYPISSEQADLSDSIKKTLPYFNYYIVELGLNVCVGQEATIPELKFEVDLYSNGKDRSDVTTNSVAPTDSIRKVKIVDGKITIGISKLLELIPAPVGGVFSNLINIDINPIEFKWELTKYIIDASGPLNYKAYWRVHDTDNVQSFNPIMVLRAKKNISKISAKARAIYVLKFSKLGIFRHTEIYSDEKKVSVLPL